MKEGKGTFFSFFQTLPPFLQKLLTGLQIFADRKVPAVRPFFKGEMRGGVRKAGEPVEKDWKLKRSDTGDPTAFPANFSDDSDNSDDSDPAPPGCAVASNALYKGRHERSGKKPTTVPP